MLIGKRYELRKATVATDIADGKRSVFQIPEGSEIKVVSGPKEGEETMDVLWNGKIVTMFREDVEARGDEIVEKPARQNEARVRATNA